MTNQDKMQRLMVVMNSMPHQRLGQLLVNATHDETRQLTPKDHLMDIFYMEDEDLLRKLELHLKATGNV